jgi:hypothetical protein
MVTPPTTPKRFAEVTVQVPIIARQLEPATVTWSRDADGWWWFKVNGEDAMALSPAVALQMAQEIVNRDKAAELPPAPTPEV